MDNTGNEAVTSIVLEVKEILAFLAITLENQHDISEEETAGIANIIRYCYNRIGGIPDMIGES